MSTKITFHHMKKTFIFTEHNLTIIDHQNIESDNVIKHTAIDNSKNILEYAYALKLEADEIDINTDLDQVVQEHHDHELALIMLLLEFVLFKTVFAYSIEIE